MLGKDRRRRIECVLDITENYALQRLHFNVAVCQHVEFHIKDFGILWEKCLTQHCVRSLVLHKNYVYNVVYPLMSMDLSQLILNLSRFDYR